MGIERKYFGRIFRMFESLDPEEGRDSTGIGLTIVKRIVEQKHGGSITVESEPGKGATFILQLPLPD